jgi:four helix bundle protein
MYVYSFEKLDAWKLAKELVVKIYKLTSQFPPEENFGITSHIRRASVSVCSNLAEGCGRSTSKDQGNFYNKAYSSLMEVLNQLLISHDLNWISEKDLTDIRVEVEAVSLKINSLRKSVLTKL